MTKAQAREFLYDFVCSVQRRGVPKRDALDIFDLCFGMEEEYEREAYALVPEAYPHIVEVVYSDW